MTKVLIVLSPSFTDLDLFEIELLKALKQFKKMNNLNYNKFEYVYLDSPANRLISSILNKLKFKQTKIKPDWKNIKKASSKNLNNMLKYVIKDYNLVIDFSENWDLLSYKKNLYKKYSRSINLYIIKYIIGYDTLKCCDQDLTYLNDLYGIDDDIFDYFTCDICKNRYALYQEIMDQFLATNLIFEIIHRKSYIKGEF